MFSFFRTKKITPTYPGFSWLSQDIHSHILPGIDDGSPDVETSIQLLQSLSDAGIRRFICTPHIIGDLYHNTPETINNALSKLKMAVQQKGMDLEISAGAEYMMDDHFLELLRNKEPLMHPERYPYYHHNFDAYYRMKELGFLLQVNLLSLTGYYGKKVAKAAKFILENKLADYVGTDLHHFNHLHVLTDSKSIGIFEKYLGDRVYNEF